MKDSLDEKLEALKKDKRRSQSARFREVFERVQRALSEGIPRVAVWEALREEGFTFTLHTFDTLLYRLRKRMAAQVPQTPPETSPKPTQAQASSTQASPKSGPAESSTPEVDDPHYSAFRESIQHLSPREQHKREGIYWTSRPR